MASPQLSGYQCEFVESVGDYECPLCLHVTREPGLTSCCGQHFCQVCIQKILTDNEPCPLCKENSFTTLLDKKQRRRVLDLKVYCDKKADGCDWVSGLGEIEKHLSEKCQFVSVDCQYNCGKTYMRRFLTEHKTNDCPKRPHSCEYCQLVRTYQEIQDDHFPVCPKYPVRYPNQCGVAPPERDQLEGHLRECPLEMVECELKELGCDEVVQRKDADKHTEQAAQKHLRLSTSYFIENQKRQNEKVIMQGEAIAKLQEENEKLKESFEKRELSAVANKHEAIAKLRQENGEIEPDLDSKSKELSALSSQVDILRRYVSISVTNVTVKYKKKRGTETRWTNCGQFRTAPTGYTLKVNLYFYMYHNLDFELTPTNARSNDHLKWPKTFTMTVTMLNQTGGNYSHHHITKDLEVTREGFNDEIQMDYDTIDNPPPGVNYIDNDRVNFQIFVTEKYLSS